MKALSIALWAVAMVDGTLLVALWLGRGGFREANPPDAGERPQRSLVAHMVVTHATFALVGFALWVAVVGNPIYDNRDAGGFVITVVVLTAVWGAYMFVRWWRGRQWSRREGYPAWAEQKLPLPAVLGHGLFGMAAVVLTVVAIIS